MDSSKLFYLHFNMHAHIIHIYSRTSRYLILQKESHRRKLFKKKITPYLSVYMAYRLSSFKSFKVCASCVHSFGNVFLMDLLILISCYYDLMGVKYMSHVKYLLIHVLFAHSIDIVCYCMWPFNLVYLYPDLQGVPGSLAYGLLIQHFWR
jgi:hypothetical protein